MWTATKRHTVLPNGRKRTLYTNIGYPGEYRIRKMKRGGDGRMRATFVELSSGVVFQKGGSPLDPTQWFTHNTGSPEGYYMLLRGIPAGTVFYKRIQHSVRHFTAHV